MKAILKDGLICPKEPVPPEWSDGTELEVQKSSKSDSDIETRFRQLRAHWRADTLVLSDSKKIMEHPAMRAIIAMGEDVVPVILRDLRDDPSLLVWALAKIVGENPPFRGNNEQMIKAWLQWGREKGLL